MIKMPPKEKIYEAYSAIIDNRIEMYKDYAVVTSSNQKKKYLVHWEDNTYYSNDNASYFQGYPGYPIIAVWMLQGILDYSREHAVYFKNVPWNSLNLEYRRNYKAVVEMLLNKLSKQNIDILIIQKEVDSIYRKIESLNMIIKRGKSTL